jgi:hypothetical protein
MSTPIPYRGLNRALRVLRGRVLGSEQLRFPASAKPPRFPRARARFARDGAAGEHAVLNVHQTLPGGCQLSTLNCPNTSSVSIRDRA